MKEWKGKFYERKTAKKFDSCRGCCFRYQFVDGCVEVRKNVGDCTEDVRNHFGTFVFKEVDKPVNPFIVVSK